MKNVAKAISADGAVVLLVTHIADEGWYVLSDFLPVWHRVAQMMAATKGDALERNNLPDTKAGRVDWVIRAKTNEEMRRRYDLWAHVYDDDVGSYEDYLVPKEATKIAEQFLHKEALIVDAGAGTGLVGQTMKESGYKRLIAVDYSEGMLEIARQKDVYEKLLLCDLSGPTELGTASVDCVITCGTTTQMPCASLREFVRIVRPGGHVIFAVVPDAWAKFGYSDVYSELEAAGRISVFSRGEPFQMLPTTEPEFFSEIWVMNVH